MSISPAVRREQHDAVSGAPRRIVEPPLARRIETDDGLHPTRTVEIGPLIGEAQMHFDDAAADGLEVEQPGVALEMLPTPGTAPVLDRGCWHCMHFPIVESASTAGNAGRMTPPLRFAIDQGHVTADMVAFEQRRPEMTRLVSVGVIVGREEGAAAHAHALEVVDGLGKHGIILRSDAMRRCCQSLTERYGKLVVDPAMRRIPHPAVAVLSGNENVRWARHTLEILSAPWIDLANRHLHPYVRGCPQ